MNEIEPSTTARQTKVCWLFLLIGLAVLFLDQATKAWVYNHLPVIDGEDYWYPYGGLGIFENLGGIEFSINHMTNTGAAWGVLGNHQLPLIILRIALIIGLIVYLFAFNRHRSWQLPLILITAGAAGNVVDFFVYGHVVDMFHFVLWDYDFPVFNVADSAITVGIVSLFILSSIQNTPEENS